MPKIKPFRGIHPGKNFAGQVVLKLENLSLSEAKLIRQENPYSYVNMLVPKLDNFFLLGSRNELAFKKINENFEEFLDEGILVKDPEPSIYVYQINREGYSQTGIWTTTSIDDYLNNVVRKHELTRADREQSLIDYLQQTGIDANPVLITYKSVPEIERILSQTILNEPDIIYTKENSEHKLWIIDQKAIITSVIKAFTSLPSSYIADGHHRAAAASLYGIQRRKLNLKHRGDEEYNFFTSVYMSTDQLKIYGFNRMVKDLKGLSVSGFLEKLKLDFNIIISDNVVVPTVMHSFGLYLDEKWFLLEFKHELNCKSPVEDLNVSILQEYIFSRILGISDPRTDPAIDFMPGPLPINDLISKVDQNEFALAFTLFPTSIQQLIRVADEGEVMPPKSTWFEPKFDVGLLIHQIN
ncbi:DUF1015 domain-containing protein [Daejeonella sp.]|uniref:DUF1015 domain-containing protein n=1 Tax=Daejeonella sp. TaxID=2805397 RepID=UPI00272FD995|nr:DUF1015 domain-containing protein [Daejeonella sp.]MDP2413605.1 DUF1015 domain-containing protein [Daejeonella sp.]